VRTSSLQRFVLALLPASVILSVVFSTIWGKNGFITRHKLRQELAQANAQLADIDRSNQRYLRKLKLMEKDPLNLERMVAEELARGRTDTVIYQFLTP
jgi:cell division protein FtsB